MGTITFEKNKTKPLLTAIESAIREYKNAEVKDLAKYVLEIGNSLYLLLNLYMDNGDPDD